WAAALGASAAMHSTRAASTVTVSVARVFSGPAGRRPFMLAMLTHRGAGVNHRPRRPAGEALDAPGGLALAAGDRVHDHSGKEDAAGDHELDGGLEREQIHSVGDGADHERTEQRRPHRAPPTEEARARDHRTRDREEQQIIP